MTTPSTDELLNDLLVEIHRSLLQYMHEAWPWKHVGDEPVQRVIEEAARAQQDHARSLYQLISSHGETPDVGVYPADFTRLHFVSLDFLYPLIVAGQTRLVAQLQSTAKQLGSENQAKSIVEGILSAEQASLAKLQSVSPARSMAVSMVH